MTRGPHLDGRSYGHSVDTNLLGIVLVGGLTGYTQTTFGH
jgi:hypothetical protein